jgi:hypothetical protein
MLLDLKYHDLSLIFQLLSAPSFSRQERRQGARGMKVRGKMLVDDVA